MSLCCRQAFSAVSPGSHNVDYPDWIQDMTEEQAEVMSAPHSAHTNRGARPKM